MTISEFFEKHFGNKTSIVLNEKVITDKAYKLAIEDFAIQMAINMIAGVIAKCEIKTMINGKCIEGDDYYTWNYQPNVNQSGTAFISELISKLLYKNKCLVVESSQQFIIADSFNRTENVLYPNVYDNVSRKNFTFNKTFYEPDVFYFEYANSDIKGLLSSLMCGYSELIELSMSKYKRAGGRKGVVDVDVAAAKTEEAQKELNELFNKRFSNFFNNENAVIRLPRGVKYTDISSPSNQKSTSDVTDITNLTKEAFIRTAQAFKIPPSLLIGDIADVDKLVKQMMTFCICPLISMLEDEINRKYYGREAFLNGSKIIIDTTAIKHIDWFELASAADKLIADGIFSIDELRKKIGETPLNTYWSKKHYLTKNYAELTETGKADETNKGGEKVA